jgi:hypothetical protein
MCVAPSELYDKPQGKYIVRQITSLCALYPKVCATVYFRFKLHLQVRKEKKIFFDCIFQYRLRAMKYIHSFIQYSV